jgi:O-antigen/teichoic acid export membrane protein
LENSKNKHLLLNRDSFFSKFKKLSGFAIFQTVSQLANALTGFLVIREMEKNIYGLYTIYFSIQSIIMQASGIGINMGMSVIGGRVWNNKKQMGQLVSTLFSIRTFLFKWLLIPFYIYAIWMLYTNNASWIQIIFVLVALTINIWLQIQTNLLGDVAKTLSQIFILAKAELLNSLTKLLFLALAVYFKILSFYIAIGIVVVAVLVQKIFTLKATNNLYIKNQPVNKAFKKEIFALMKPDVLNTFYFLFQGQLVLIFLSVYKGLNGIAEVTAIGRFVLLFGIFNNAINAVFMPAIARTQSVNKLIKHFFLIGALYILAIAITLAITYFFPNQILWLLGNQYSSLNHLLFISMVCACFNQFIGFLWVFVSTKGWVKYHWLYTPFSIINQIIVIILLDFNKTENIIWFGALGNIGFLAVNVLSLSLGFFGKKVQPE